jgi:hypothetical protein
LAAVAKPANIGDSYPPGDYGNPTKISGYPTLESGSVSSDLNNEQYDEESYDQQETFAYYDEGEDKIGKSTEAPEVFGSPGLAGALGAPAPGAPGAPAPGAPGAFGPALGAPDHSETSFPDNTGKELFVLYYTVNIFEICSLALQSWETLSQNSLIQIENVDPLYAVTMLLRFSEKRRCLFLILRCKNTPAIYS